MSTVDLGLHRPAVLARRLEHPLASCREHDRIVGRMNHPPGGCRHHVTARVHFHRNRTGVYFRKAACASGGVHFGNGRTTATAGSYAAGALAVTRMGAGAGLATAVGAAPAARRNILGRCGERWWQRRRDERSRESRQSRRRRLRPCQLHEALATSARSDSAWSFCSDGSSSSFSTWSNCSRARAVAPSR
jgi:hypothetical protein